MPTYEPARLKAARATAGLTQLALADAIHRDVNTVWRYESGDMLPTVRMLGAIATPREPERPRVTVACCNSGHFVGHFVGPDVAGHPLKVCPDKSAVTGLNGLGGRPLDGLLISGLGVRFPRGAPPRGPGFIGIQAPGDHRTDSRERGGHFTSHFTGHVTLTRSDVSRHRDVPSRRDLEVPSRGRTMNP